MVDLNDRLLAVDSPLNDRPDLANPTENRFVPGGYITGPNANQRFYTQVVSSSTLGSNPIQAAINEANRVGGGKVYLKTGTYTLGTNLDLFSNVQLVGEDADTTVINFGSANYQVRAFGTSGAGNSLANILVENITFSGRRDTNSSRAAVHFQFCNDSAIKECVFTNNWDGTITNNVDINLRNNSSRIEVSSNRFISSGLALYAGMNDANVFNNYFGTCNDTAIQINANRLNIYGNYFIGCAKEIIFSGDDNTFMTFSNNHILGHTGTAAVSLGNNGGIANYMNIEGNIFEGTTNSGICIFGTAATSGLRRSSIVGNSILGFGSEGIKAVGSVNYVSMTGNVIRSNSGYGVDFGSLTSSNILIGNVTSGNGVGGTQNYIDRTGGNNIFDSTGNYNVT